MSTPHQGCAVLSAWEPQASLGEGPWWDEARNELRWVDIDAGQVWVGQPSGDARIVLERPDTSAVIGRADGGYVVAAGDCVELYTAEMGLERSYALPLVKGVRLNDCKCDRAGNLWAGTMARDRTPGAGALFRVRADGTVTKMLDGTTISNGLGWSPDDRHFYLIDSAAMRIDVFDFDPRDASISNRRRFIDTSHLPGKPDGLCVDADGGLWVCFYGGGQLVRFDSQGTITDRTSLPTTHPTSAAFAGPSSNLFVTTATRALTGAPVANDDVAGKALAVPTSRTGSEVFTFGG